MPPHLISNEANRVCKLHSPRLITFANDGQLTDRMANDKVATFDPNPMRHFDRGYAVTSHSSQ
jgi:hypothetical protein